MKSYLIAAAVTRTVDGYTNTRHLPLFVLDGDIHGLVDADHAERIAREIVDPFGESTATYIFAHPVES